MRTVTALLVLSLAACTARPAPSTPARAGERLEEESRTPAGEAFERALDAALKRGAWSDLWIDSDCQDKTNLPRSIRLYGNGVGIWNHQRQFAVPRERLLGLLSELDRARFSRMRETFEADEGEGEEEEMETSCRVQAGLDGTEKQALQISEEEEESALKALADRVLAVGEELGPSGMAVGSLQEGLEKVARGELAPEALTVQLLRQPENLRSGETGWMLRVEGGEARLSLISPDTGWSQPRRVRLSAAEVADLARSVAAARPEELPVNLYSRWYQSLEIGVLNRTKSIQARQFARMTAETHGEKQERFDRFVAVLEALEARVGSP
jgi:hypothetical protein